MRKVILCFSIIITILFTGCFNYKDIDKVIFVTSVIIDVDGTGNPVMYFEAFKPTRGANGSSGKGEKVLFQGTAKTILEISRDINLSSSYKINYTQNRGVIFTEKAAQKGLENFIDPFSRSQEAVVRAHIVILKGDPQKLLTIKLKEQDYIGLFLEDLVFNIGNSSRAVELNLNDFLNKSFSGNNTAVITTIAMKKEQLEDKLEISDAAVIKDFKLVDIIDRRQGEGYNFLINNIKSGTLEVSNPDAPDKFISLGILKSKTDTKISYDGEKIRVKKIIRTRAAIQDVQKKLIFQKPSIDGIEKNAESNIQRACMTLFEEYKKKNLDIFDIEDQFHRKYPKEKVTDVMAKSQLELEVHVTVKGSPIKMDFRYGSQ